MPTVKEDRYSGAIIFYPTPMEEKEIERRKRMENKEKELDEKLAKVTALLDKLEEDK